MSDCKHDGRMKKYVDLLAGDHVLRWKCAKCNERFSPTVAAHADGIEAARDAVAAVVDETKDIVGLVVADQVLGAIDALTIGPETEG